MSRHVWPLVFTLRATALVEATRQQKTPPVRDKYFPKSTGLFPVALRWSTTPNLGFPREPFQVFRRQRDNAAEKALYEQAITSAVTISGDANVPFFTGDYAYVARVSVTVASGSSLILSAIDANFRIMTAEAPQGGSAPPSDTAVG